MIYSPVAVRSRGSSSTRVQRDAPRWFLGLFASRCSSAAAGFRRGRVRRRPARRPRAPSWELVQIPQPHRAPLREHGVRAHDRRVVALLGEAVARLKASRPGHRRRAGCPRGTQRLVEDVRLAARVRCREGGSSTSSTAAAAASSATCSRRWGVALAAWRPLYEQWCAAQLWWRLRDVRWVNAKGTAERVVNSVLAGSLRASFGSLPAFRIG